jgi:hypothetical protein
MAGVRRGVAQGGLGLLGMLASAACGSNGSVVARSDAGSIQPTRDASHTDAPRASRDGAIDARRVDAPHSHDSSMPDAPARGTPEAALPDAGSDATTAPISYGVLEADPSHLAIDSDAGVRWAQVTVGWNDLEPTQGTYVASAIPLTTIQTYRSAGWKIELSFGLHYPPTWATLVEPWVDQNGATYTQQANWFNASVQKEISAEIAYVIGSIGPGNIDAIRIGGLTSAGEMIYPVTPAYDYVAYSASALSGTSLAPANPVPTCKPPTCGQADATTFYGWYVDSLAAFGNFEVAAARQAGFTGDVQWLMPGVGVRPSWLAMLLANGLDLSAQYPNDYDISAGGCEWPRIMGDIADKNAQVVIDCTSLNDSSAVGANESSSNDLDWSSAHWVAYNADQLGFRKSGENKGEDGDAGMALAFEKVTAYGYEKLMWAFDDQLYSGQYASIQSYAAFIRANP